MNDKNKIGMDPSWRHIIPPAQDRVISEGHCTDDCTKKSFPPQGISIFATIMQTHNIGKEVKLRQVLLPLHIYNFYGSEFETLIK